MATFDQRTGPDGKLVYRVRVRRKGHATQTATFTRLTDAKKWAQITEAVVFEGRHFKTIEAKRHTLADLIDRYIMELLSLRWPDVDLKRGTLTFHQTKNGERRAVPLPGQALMVMQQHAKVRRLDTVLVFPDTTGKRALGIREAFEGAVKRADIQNFHFHDLRHTFASYLAMNGATLAEIAEALGHKTLAMVKRYAHLTEAHTRGVVERMNRAIFGQ